GPTLEPRSGSKITARLQNYSPPLNGVSPPRAGLTVRRPDSPGGVKTRVDSPHPSMPERLLIAEPTRPAVGSAGGRRRRVHSEAAQTKVRQAPPPEARSASDVPALSSHYGCCEDQCDRDPRGRGSRTGEAVRPPRACRRELPRVPRLPAAAADRR